MNIPNGLDAKSSRDVNTCIVVMIILTAIGLTGLVSNGHQLFYVPLVIAGVIYAWMMGIVHVMARIERL